LLALASHRSSAAAGFFVEREQLFRRKREGGAQPCLYIHLLKDGGREMKLGSDELLQVHLPALNVNQSGKKNFSSKTGPG